MRPKTFGIFKTVLVAPAIVLLMAMACQQPDASMKLKPILDAYAEAWNAGDLDALDAIVAPQFVRLVGSDTSAAGLDSLKQAISSFRTTYPDFHVTLQEEIYAGDKVVGRWSFTATNTGPGDFPPTGKQVTLTGMSIFQITDGKIVEERIEIDNLNFMEQHGFTLIPPAVAEE